MMVNIMRSCVLVCMEGFNFEKSLLNMNLQISFIRMLFCCFASCVNDRTNPETVQNSKNSPRGVLIITFRSQMVVVLVPKAI